ncbi:MAG: DUF1700 domain-containing protein [Abditibacteriota bacterium]|nr:DUF1700 domain-containing protein [Oscillospiraceae bacterium]MBQ9357968.1 DUF1700 domain-containing protein [Abditibacteriota bacterium]
MNKTEFLDRLREELRGLPQDDIEERLSFYGEMIDDRVEEGLTEEEAVDELGGVDEVVAQIMSEIPLTRLVRERVRPKRALRIGEIVLLVLGSPIWLSLLIAAAAVVLSLYVVIWSVVTAVYAVELALAVSALACIPGAIIMLRAGRAPEAAFAIGAGLICAGLAILLFFGCVWITKAMLKLTKSIILGIKSLFIGKEAA